MTVAADPGHIRSAEAQGLVPTDAGLIYFSSASNYTHRFVEKLELPEDRVARLPLITREPVSYTHLTLPTIHVECRSRWSPYH